MERWRDENGGQIYSDLLRFSQFRGLNTREIEDAGCAKQREITRINENERE